MTLPSLFPQEANKALIRDVRAAENRAAGFAAARREIERTINDKERIISHLHIQQARNWQAFCAATKTEYREKPIADFPSLSSGSASEPSETSELASQSSLPPNY